MSGRGALGYHVSDLGVLGYIRFCYIALVRFSRTGAMSGGHLQSQVEQLATMHDAGMHVSTYRCVHAYITSYVVLLRARTLIVPRKTAGKSPRTLGIESAMSRFLLPRPKRRLFKQNHTNAPRPISSPPPHRRTKPKLHPLLRATTPIHRPSTAHTRPPSARHPCRAAARSRRWHPSTARTRPSHRRRRARRPSRSPRCRAAGPSAHSCSGRGCGGRTA